jgi:hypothetical protein
MPKVKACAGHGFKCSTAVRKVAPTAPSGALGFAPTAPTRSGALSLLEQGRRIAHPETAALFIVELGEHAVLDQHAVAA